MIIIENTGSIPEGWRTRLEQNLRLPTGMDSDMLDDQLKAAIAVVEKHTGTCIIDKTVTELFSLPKIKYFYNYRPSTITTIKKNGEALTASDYTLYSGFFILKSKALRDDVIEVEYNVVSKYNDDHKNVVIVIASALYNNPEGLGLIDMRKFNYLLNSIK